MLLQLYNELLSLDRLNKSKKSDELFVLIVQLDYQIFPEKL